MTNLNEYMRNNRDGSSMNYVKPINCKNGLTFSCQASSFNYATPRKDGAVYYSEVEIGFPNREIADLMKYAETPEEPKQTAYPYVPVDIIEKIISDNGGLV